MTDIQTNHLKGKAGIKRIIHAAHYSKDGFQAAFIHEAAFRQLLLLHGILLIGGCWLDVDTSIHMMLIGTSFLSLIVELLNSAIEAVVDDISLELRPLAKRAKDLGSAAQMLSLVLLAIIWLMALCA